MNRIEKNIVYRVAVFRGEFGSVFRGYVGVDLLTLFLAIQCLKTRFWQVGDGEMLEKNTKKKKS